MGCELAVSPNLLTEMLLRELPWGPPLGNDQEIAEAVVAIVREWFRRSDVQQAIVRVLTEVQW